MQADDHVEVVFLSRISATALWLAGPRQERLVSSHTLHITRLALTEAPDPELDPSDAPRVLS